MAFFGKWINNGEDSPPLGIVPVPDFGLLGGELFFGGGGGEEVILFQSHLSRRVWEFFTICTNLSVIYVVFFKDFRYFPPVPPCFSWYQKASLHENTSPPLKFTLSHNLILFLSVNAMHVLFLKKFVPFLWGPIASEFLLSENHCFVGFRRVSPQQRSVLLWNVFFCQPCVSYMNRSQPILFAAIQQRAIVPFIQGGDIIAQAQSGTGKTGAFSIGLLQRMDMCRQSLWPRLFLPGVFPTPHLSCPSTYSSFLPQTLGEGEVVIFPQKHLRSFPSLFGCWKIDLPIMHILWGGAADDWPRKHYYYYIFNSTGMRAGWW